jgi:pimeloyl-ACP methyl ester carboxylesterase
VIETFYFGHAPKLLYGAYHPPRLDCAGRVGVVLCYPIGQEYMRAHRAFLRLAHLLAEQGCHVLRFDYYGSGDSSGECAELGVAQCIADISTAVEELKEGSNLAHVCLVGLRWGASLAALAAADRSDIDAIVLWEPIADGHAYIHELLCLHAQWLRGSFARIPPGQQYEQGIETLGFPMPDALLAQIRQTQLRSLGRCPARKAMLIQSSDIPDDVHLAEHFRSLGCDLTPRHIPAPKTWLKTTDDGQLGDKGLVPVNVLQAIVSWVQAQLP